MMLALLLERKRMLTTILAGLGIGIILFYVFCADSCQYLKGAMGGIDLTYMGLIFLGVILVFTFLKKDALCLLLLSFALGGEIFLIGYQIVNNVYCPYCLAFGGVLLLLFFLHYDKNKITAIALAAFGGFIFFILSFTGSVIPAYAEEDFITSFGSGPVEVRLYTDYFCGPCRAAEPELEPLLRKLVDKKAIRLTFVDTPVHKYTPLYARYFLYILKENRNFSHALAARAALYDAAERRISSEAELNFFLASRGLAFSAFDVNPIFQILGRHLREDKIRATPSIVISESKGKKLYQGGKDIIEALRSIGQREGSGPLPPSPGLKQNPPEEQQK